MRKNWLVALVVAYAALGALISDALALRGDIDARGEYKDTVFAGKSEFCGLFTMVAIGPDMLTAPSHCLWKQGRKANSVSAYVLDAKGMWHRKLIAARHWDVPDEYKRFRADRDRLEARWNTLSDLEKRWLEHQITRAKPAAYDTGVVIFPKAITSRPVQTALDDALFETGITEYSTADGSMVPGSTAQVNRALDAFLTKYPGAELVAVGVGATSCAWNFSALKWERCVVDRQHTYRRVAKVRVNPNTILLGRGEYGITLQFVGTDGEGVGYPGDSGGGIFLVTKEGKRFLLGTNAMGDGRSNVATALPFLATFIQKHRVMAKGK